MEDYRGIWFVVGVVILVILVIIVLNFVNLRVGCMGFDYSYDDGGCGDELCKFGEEDYVTCPQDCICQITNPEMLFELRATYGAIVLIMVVILIYRLFVLKKKGK